MVSKYLNFASFAKDVNLIILYAYCDLPPILLARHGHTINCLHLRTVLRVFYVTHIFTL
jgi:hypothetical protein